MFSKSTVASGEDDDEDIYLLSDNNDQPYSDRFDSDVEQELYQKVFYVPQVEPSTVIDVSPSSDEESLNNSARKEVKDVSRTKRKLKKKRLRAKSGVTDIAISSSPPQADSVINVSSSDLSSPSCSGTNCNIRDRTDVNQVNDSSRRKRKLTKKSFQTNSNNKSIVKPCVTEVTIPSSGESSDDSVVLIDSWDSANSELVTNVSSKLSSSVELDSDSDSSLASYESFKDKFTPIVLDSASTDDSSTEDDTISSKSASLPSQKRISSARKNPWHLDPEDVKGTCKRSKRYYTKDIVCRRCREAGHNQKDCVGPGFLKCFLCGGDHMATHCVNRVCGVCFGKGHSRNQCPKNRFDVLCQLCKVRGHSSNRCPDLWRRYHLTTTPGSHLVKMPAQLRNDKVNYCYNCGLSGHLGHVCDRLRWNSYSEPSSPYVVSYEDFKSLRGSSTSGLKKINRSPSFKKFKGSSKNFTPTQSTPQRTPKKKKAVNLLGFHESEFARTPKSNINRSQSEAASKKKLSVKQRKKRLKKKVEKYMNRHYLAGSV